MIKVAYDRGKYMLSVHGHACFSDYGTDIVCSASSILAYALAATLEDLEKEGFLTDLQVRMTGGLADISCGLRGQKGALVVRAAFDTIVTGYQLLSEKYPEFINVQNF